MVFAVLTTLAALQHVVWEPARPIQGSLIVVSAPDGAIGLLAGEPLYFVNGRTFAAVPLSAKDSLALEVLTQHEGVIARDVRWVPIAAWSPSPATSSTAAPPSTSSMAWD